jgi:hypothetical protein
MKKDLIIVKGPSLNALRKSLDEYFEGREQEVSFLIFDTQLPKKDVDYRAVQYVGYITGLVNCHRKEEGKSAFVNVFGRFRPEYGHCWFDVQINGYNTRNPRDGKAHVILLSRRISNPENKKKGKPRPRENREKSR